MKLKLLVDNQENLQTLAKMPFEMQTVWDLSNAVDEVTKALEKFQKTRDELLKTDGDPNEDVPGTYKLRDPEAFTEKINKLLDVDVKITFPKIPYEAFTDKKVTASQIRGWKALDIIQNPVKKKKDEK